MTALGNLANLRGLSTAPPLPGGEPARPAAKDADIYARGLVAKESSEAARRAACGTASCAAGLLMSYATPSSTDGRQPRLLDSRKERFQVLSLRFYSKIGATARAEKS